MSETTTPSTDYLRQHLPPTILEKLEAGAFRQLCTHLADRSDEVQNIDLMTLSGFCRNCLAKWLVMEARNMEGLGDSAVKHALDALGYDEAAQYVYGCEYGEWKKRHAKKASDEQMQKFNESKPLWAKHNKEVLATKAEKLLATPEMSETTTPSTDYLRQHLPPTILEKLEAGAFRQLCTHLADRSDEVQNIDLMTLSGFCRNCLAKWLVMEARNMEGLGDSAVQQALDALGYDEAAQYVYGCEYGEWKKRHAKKASDEQMQKFNESKPVWAKHNKEVLATKAEKPVKAMNAAPEPASSVVSPSGNVSKSLLSNVCCQDIEETPKCTPPPLETKKARTLSPIEAPAPPKGGVSFNIGILTVSDRAFANQYETGDLSGPAVEESVKSTILSMNDSSVNCNILHKAIVPDDIGKIQTLLKQWSSQNNGDSAVDVIFTTGGTGFAPRDVTPEATLDVLDRECKGLMAYVMTECSLQQPLASLSRGTAGLIGQSMIVNLPGNPKGVGEIIPVLLPLVLHAIKDLQQKQ